MRVAILGGGSCFAMNLAVHLTGRSDEVLSISRSPLRGEPFTLGLENNPLFRYAVSHLVLQLDETMALLDEFRPEVIINYAALCELNQSWKTPDHYYETNLMAMVRLVRQLQARDWLRLFLHVGTSEVYGSVTAPALEDDPIRCSSPYAASKAAFDLHLGAVSKHQKFPSIVIRPSNGYCEGQTLNRIIPKTIISALTGTRLKLQGGGVAQKSYLHADDISKATMLLMEKGTLGEVYNAGPGWPISIRGVVDLVARMCGKRLGDVVEFVEERVGQDSMYRLNSKKLEQLGWKPKINLQDGVQRMIDWVNCYPELLSADTAYVHKS